MATLSELGLQRNLSKNNSLLVNPDAIFNQYLSSTLSNNASSSTTSSTTALSATITAGSTQSDFTYISSSGASNRITITQSSIFANYASNIIRLQISDGILQFYNPSGSTGCAVTMDANGLQVTSTLPTYINQKLIYKTVPLPIISCGSISSIGTALSLPTGITSSQIAVGQYRITHTGTYSFCVLTPSTNVIGYYTLSSGTSDFFFTDLLSAPVDTSFSFMVGVQS